MIYFKMRLNRDKFDKLTNILSKRILILDGAMGSVLQHCNHCFHESGYTEACIPDLLVLENPSLVVDIHDQYLDAGADIIETNSFNSNRFSLRDYQFEKEAYRLSFEAARLARKSVDKYNLLTPGKPRFVAGSVGPTKHMLSLEGEDSEITFDSLSAAYSEQIAGLLDGGADVILLETIFDTLTAKAALYTIGNIEEKRGIKIPVMISGTVSDKSGRLLGGQSLDAFVISMEYSRPLSIGLNCGFGSAQILPYLREIAGIANVAVSVYPNAGLPNESGLYNESPEIFASNLEACLKEGLVNIVGGCCGTSPSHIRMVTEMVKGYAPRTIPERRNGLCLSNREGRKLNSTDGLIHVGERTNVAGSKKFARLIRENKFDEALEIVCDQIKNGAQVIDICMDDAMQDSTANMNRLLRMINSDMEGSSVPVMIDSSEWKLVLSALKLCPGKPIVNSISLKDGETPFIEKAREIKKLGAAMIVMLFDEEGQAVTYQRKIDIAGRAYKLLINEGISPFDIIFDPNVLTLGIDTSDQNSAALDFINATSWIKKNLPGASVSGGISNLSFAFRGNNIIRNAMHSVFLHHAFKAGLDLAIVNPSSLISYSDLDSALTRILEDVILNKRPNAVESLIEYADNLANNQIMSGDGDFEKPLLTPTERIARHLMKGNVGELISDMQDLITTVSPIDIINGYLLPVMNKIGEMFGEGRMFLPQVIKSAQSMNKAVEFLSPYFEENGNKERNANIIIATVKGDVHDIGKNIVSLVVSCQGFQVLDLGVRVEPKEIADKVYENNPVALLLSGLISPSLHEMINVCKELESRGLQLPVIIGGAATSEIHTAVKIAPVYSGPVFYSSDASANLKILKNLEVNKMETVNKNLIRQRKLRADYEDYKAKKHIIANNENNKFDEAKKPRKITKPTSLRKHVFNSLTIESVEEYIDWEFLLSSLDLNRDRKFSDSNQYKHKILGEVKILFEKIKKENLLSIEGVVEIFKARSKDGDIIITTKSGEEKTIPMLKNESTIKDVSSVADFISNENDYIALFAVSSGKNVTELAEIYSQKGDYYSAFLVKLIADRLAEASAQWMSCFVANELWGFGKTVGNNGVRLAIGYPAVPDHTVKREIFDLLEVEKHTSMSLTETCMITPSESVCGFILPEGKYFNVGKISNRQLLEYAKKRNISYEKLVSIIPNNVSL